MGVKVTNIPGAYAFEGKSYGPFSATNKKEFVEVPADLAASLNLPLHESELNPAQDEIQPEGADIQELLDANASLKEGLDLVNAELESTQSDFIRYQNDLPGLRARLAELEAGAAADEASQAAVATTEAIEANTAATKQATHAPKKAAKP